MAIALPNFSTPLHFTLLAACVHATYHLWIRSVHSFHSFQFFHSFAVQAHAVDYYYKHYDRISLAAAMSVPAAGNEISLSLRNRNGEIERERGRFNPLTHKMPNLRLPVYVAQPFGLSATSSSSSWTSWTSLSSSCSSAAASSFDCNEFSGQVRFRLQLAASCFIEFHFNVAFIV